MRELGADVPRVIWMMWLQGLEKAPPIVKNCYASWKKHHPDWEIILLDSENVEAYVDVPGIVGDNYHDLPKQALSDIVRLNLLKKYGGVWVDATCFCCVPLDEWLGSYMASGFFAFRSSERDRLLSSWFLASSRDCHLTSKWCEEVNLYWSRNRFANSRRKLARVVLGKVLNRNASSTNLWFSPFVTKVLRQRPYFWFHYLFATIIRKDGRCAQMWEETGYYSANIPHGLQNSGLLEPISETLKREIDGRETPLYKLTWRYDESKYLEGCALDYLFRSIRDEGRVPSLSWRAAATRSKRYEINA